MCHNVSRAVTQGVHNLRSASKRSALVCIKRGIDLSSSGTWYIQNGPVKTRPVLAATLAPTTLKIYNNCSVICVQL